MAVQGPLIVFEIILVVADLLCLKVAGNSYHAHFYGSALLWGTTIMAVCLAFCIINVSYDRLRCVAVVLGLLAAIGPVQATTLDLTATQQLARLATVDIACPAIETIGTLLPCGMFHTQGSQIVDQQNRPVRLSCIAIYENPNSSIPWSQQMLAMVVMGRNCVRISFNNASIDTDIKFINEVVIGARTAGLRVIIDNHQNESPGCSGGQQKNGIWFDQGPGSDGTDGCGLGTTSDTKFRRDWVKVAQQYTDNSTVIGFDLRNEPTRAVWGGRGPTDIHAMYEHVGNAILALDSAKLIIAECVQNYPSAPEGDCRPVASNPVKLNVANRVVYSVHEYPKETAGIESCGLSFVQRMNAAWGYLVTQNIAPVWIGEMATQFNQPMMADDKCWADTLTSYLNGTAPGGLKIPPGGQGVGTDWWAWTSGRPYGLMADKSMTMVYQDQGQMLGNLTQAALFKARQAVNPPSGSFSTDKSAESMVPMSTSQDVTNQTTAAQSKITAQEQRAQLPADNVQQQINAAIKQKDLIDRQIKRLLGRKHGETAE